MNFAWQPLSMAICRPAIVWPGVRRKTVPTYQYRCEQCEITFERTETISEHEMAKPKCPKCGSKKVSVMPGRVYVVTSKKS